MSRDPDLWLFGCWRGKAYADNPRHAFESIRNSESGVSSGVNAVWLTRRLDVRNQITELGFPAYVWWEPRGLRALSRAGVIAFTHDATDLSPIVNPGSLRVNMTHGTPMKTMGASIPKGRGGSTRAWARALRSRVTPTADLITAASAAALPRWKEAFPESEVCATGYPRWRPQLMALTRQPRRPEILLYAPTHRFFSGGRLDPARNEGFAEFTQAAREANVRLWIRPHRSGVVDLPGTDWEVWGPDRVADTADLLPNVDILITDYSSIAYDFGVMSGRLAFLVPDIGDYALHDQGFYPDALKDMQGMSFTNWSSVAAWLVDGAQPADEYGSFRRAHAHLADPLVVERFIGAVRSRQSQALVERVEIARHA